MSACEFRRYVDFVLIDSSVLKPDSHKYVVPNGIKTLGGLSPSL